MSADEQLDAAIAEVYQGPLAEFVSRRDALVKELRADGRRDEAADVKALRKPTAMAWALDAAVGNEPVSMARVVEAVGGMIDAQAGKGDTRQASSELREAVRGLATAAGGLAAEAGHRLDPSALVPALLGVVGDRDAFAALYAGRLAALPEAGGLDVFTDPPLLTLPESLADRVRQAREAEPAPEPVDDATVAAAQARVDKAVAAAADASEAVTEMESELGDAEARAEAADGALRQAERAARDARAELRRLQQELRAARDKARKADREAATTRSRLAGLPHPTPRQ